MSDPEKHSSHSLREAVFRHLDGFAVIILDAGHKIQEWNLGAEVILGYSAAEMIGKSIDLIFTPEDRENRVPEQEVKLALSTGKASDDRWHRRKDGSRFWASGEMVRLCDASGGYLGLAKVLKDETRLRTASDERADAEEALRASELRFRRLIEANIVGVGIRSLAGEWLEANDELLRILACSRDDLQQRRLRHDSLVPHEHRERERVALDEVQSRGACQPFETELLRPDGSRVPVLTGYASVSGVQEHFVFFVVDLTQQKRVERRLRDADRRKDEFLAMLAHELRNPLAPIRTALQLLKHPDVGRDMIETARETMERQVTVLVHLVDDLLDVSRIMYGKVELRRVPTDLQSVIRRGIETSHPLIDDKRHELTVSMPAKPLPLVADPIRLSQVVSNLLNNAAKYMEPGGRIQLEANRVGEQVRLSVRDTGIGIPADRIPTVFDLFSQVDTSLERAQGGLGIGLTLVRRLVEMHGGSVEARSEGLGRGSEFTVVLPLTEADTIEPEPPRASAANARPLRILVVDDNVDAADILAMLLRLQKHRVDTVNSGMAAIECASDGYDVIFLDIGLPDLNGCEVARRIRADASKQGGVLVALTGYGTESDQHLTRDAGFDRHFVKPVEPSALFALLNEVEALITKKLSDEPTA